MNTLADIVVKATLGEWKLWSDEKPEDTKALYRWRVPARQILGMTLRPEWTAKLSFVGMGYDPGEYWPPFSYWNGYVRTLPEGVEWRLAGEDETDIFWGGLDLLPSPFTGKPPKVEYCGLYIGAPPYKPEWLKIVSYMVGFNSWKDAAKMQAAWNTRTDPLAALVLEAREALAGAMDILGRAESNASGNPEWDHVGPRVAKARATLAKLEAL